MRKDSLHKQTQDLLAKNNIKPPKPLTRQQEIDQAADQYRRGEVTAFELGKALKLSDKQVLFAEAFCSPETYGDKVAAAGFAYGIDITDKNQRHKASEVGSKLGKHLGVSKLIGILLNLNGLNKVDVDARLEFLLKQNDNYGVSLQAAKLFYDLNGFNKSYTEVTIKHQYDYSNLTDEELDMYIKLKKKALAVNPDKLLTDTDNDIIDAEITDIE